MCILGFPWFLVAGGIVCVFLYSLAQHISHPSREYLAIIGLGGVGFLMLKMYWSYCTVPATFFVLILLAAAVIFKLALWVIFQARNQLG